MAYEMSGTPVVMGDNGMGGGNLGALLIGALLFGGGFGGGFGGRGYGNGFAGADLAATAGLQNQMNMVSDQISALGTNGELNAIEAQINNMNTSNLQGIAQNALTYSQGNARLATDIANANFTTLNSINGLGRDVAAQANNNALQQLNSFNVLNTTMLQGFNEVGRDQAQSFNQLIMGQNTLSAQLASCCCDLKSTIHADGEATRALINATNMATLQGQLSDAKNKINTLEIINTLKPVVTV